MIEQRCCALQILFRVVTVPDEFFAKEDSDGRDPFREATDRRAR